jgi:hypothetical protein
VQSLVDVQPASRRGLRSTLFPELNVSPDAQSPEASSHAALLCVVIAKVSHRRSTQLHSGPRGRLFRSWQASSLSTTVCLRSAKEAQAQSLPKTAGKSQALPTRRRGIDGSKIKAGSRGAGFEICTPISVRLCQVKRVECTHHLVRSASLSPLASREPHPASSTSTGQYEACRPPLPTRPTSGQSLGASKDR